MKKLPKVLAIIAAWPLLLSMLLTSAVFVAFTPQFYFREFDALHQEAAIGCERATLDNITVTLVEYMKGNVPSLHMQAVIGNDVREVFSERDKQHMVDVKYLFDIAVYGAVVGAILFAVLAACSLLLGNKGMRARTLSRGLLWGCAGFFVAAGALAAYIALDFSNAFVSFHRIFFSNDLWMLPSDSVLLMIMPQEFFLHMATYIGILFVAMLLVAVLAIGLIAFLTRHARAKEVLQPEVALGVDGPVTAVATQDGERYVIASGQEEERPQAGDIFESFGLSDKDDQPLMPDEVPTQTQSPAEQEKAHVPAPAVVVEEVPRIALASFGAFQDKTPEQAPAAQEAPAPVAEVPQAPSDSGFASFGSFGSFAQEPPEQTPPEPIEHEPQQEEVPAPAIEEPAAQEPAAFAPFAPFTQESAVQEASAPVIEEPAAQEPAAFAPFAPFAQEPAVQEAPAPAIEEPVAQESAQQEAPAPVAEPAAEEPAPLAFFTQELGLEAPMPAAEVPVEAPAMEAEAEEVVAEAPVHAIPVPYLAPVAPIAAPVAAPAVQPVAVTPLILPPSSDGVLRLQLRVPASVLTRAVQDSGMELLLEVGRQEEEAPQATPCVKIEDAPSAPARDSAALSREDMAGVLTLMDDIMQSLPYDTAE